MPKIILFWLVLERIPPSLQDIARKFKLSQRANALILEDYPGKFNN
jgi:hypothetical protein